MNYDDASLEGALLALEPAEPPTDLHARILSSLAAETAPVPPALGRPWEVWLVGVALAVAAWLILVVTGNPLAGGPEAARIAEGGFDRILAALGSALGSTSLIWLAIGGSAALWLSQLNPSVEAGSEA